MGQHLHPLGHSAYWRWGVLVLIMCSWLAVPSNRAGAQDPAAGRGDDVPAPSVLPGAGGNTSSSSSSSSATDPPELNLLWLLTQGGGLMFVILAASVAMLALVIERSLSLRRSKVMPRSLVTGLARLSADTGQLDPRAGYRLCQNYPSPLSTVIRAMLLKIGRPHSEVEHTVAEASQREADRMYDNVRWLNLIAAVTPLVGLLGTVWGMIRAFFDTTQLAAHQNRADFLAAGIYTALVTTLGGLAVAIPAAIFAHYFEGRIKSLFHQIDELLFNLLPQIERYEGRLRVSRQSLGGEDTPSARGAETAEAAAPP